MSRREVLLLMGVTSAAAMAACAPGAAGTPTATLNAEAATAEGIAANPTAIEATQGEAATLAATQAEAPGATAAATEAGAVPVPACVVRPESTEGPYFVDVDLDRADIRVEPATGQAVPGVPLALTFNVAQIGGGACTPLPGAMVDVWHCDAAGTYSGVAGSPGTKFLRGFQTTDANGLARFTTIFPGWYRGRTVHIHYKIRVPSADGNTYDFTSQLYFEEATAAEIYAREPYAARGPQDTSNARDGIFQPEGLLALSVEGEGYHTQFDIALDLGAG